MILTKRVFLQSLVLVLLFSCLGFTQNQEKVIPNKVSPKDHWELQRLAKRFVSRLQQTRDIKPLVKEFFVRRFPECLYEYSEDEVAKSNLTTQELNRAYFVAVNFLYIYYTAYLYSSDLKDSSEEAMIAHLFPASLAKHISTIGPFPELPIDGEGFDKTKFLKRLTYVELTARRAQKHLKAKNYERSSRYRKELHKWQNSDWLGYIVEPVDWDIPCVAPAKHLATIVYKVTTPIWFVPYFVKVNGRFKIVSVDIVDD